MEGSLMEYYSDELINLIADYIDKLRDSYNIDPLHSITVDSFTQYGNSNIYRIYITITPAKYLRKYIIDNNKVLFEQNIKSLYDIIKNRYNLVDVDVHVIGKRDYIMIMLNPKLGEYLFNTKTFEKLILLNEDDYDKSLFRNIDLNRYLTLLNSNIYQLNKLCLDEENKQICTNDYFSLKYHKKHKNDTIISPSENVPGQILIGNIEGIPMNGIITKIDDKRKIVYISDYDPSTMPSPTPLTLEILNNYSIPFKKYKNGYQEVEFNKKTGRYNKFNIVNLYNY